MSALLRQQVGVRAGRSTSIHPSIRLSSWPCRSSPHIRYPPQNIGCVTRWWAVRLWHHDRSVSYCASKRITNLALQRWTVRFYISARSSDVTLEGAGKDRTWRHCIEISMQRGLLVSVLGSHLYQVFPMMSSIWYLEFSGESQSLHIYKYNTLDALLAHSLIIFRSILNMWLIAFY